MSIDDARTDTRKLLSDEKANETGTHMCKEGCSQSASSLSMLPTYLANRKTVAMSCSPISAMVDAIRRMKVLTPHAKVQRGFSPGTGREPVVFGPDAVVEPSAVVIVIYHTLVTD